MYNMFCVKNRILMASCLYLFALNLLLNVYVLKLVCVDADRCVKWTINGARVCVCVLSSQVCVCELSVSVSN